MAIKVAGYDFQGPYSSTGHLEDLSGVYVIVCDEGGDSYEPVDCGESATVKSRVENHDRKGCWDQNCNGELKVAVLYTPDLQSAGRTEIEQEIRSAIIFPCGAR